MFLSAVHWFVCETVRIEKMRRCSGEDEERFTHEGLKMMRERQADRDIFACISLIGCRGPVVLWHLLLIVADNKSSLFPHWLFFTQLSFSLSLFLSVFLSVFLMLFLFACLWGDTVHFKGFVSARDTQPCNHNCLFILYFETSLCHI